MAVATAIAIAGGNRRCAQRTAVIPAFEGEHQALAVTMVAYELQRVLDGLGAADVEVNAPLMPKLALGILSDERCQFHLLTMEVLRGDLR